MSNKLFIMELAIVAYFISALFCIITHTIANVLKLPAYIVEANYALAILLIISGTILFWASFCGIIKLVVEIIKEGK